MSNLKQRLTDDELKEIEKRISKSNEINKSLRGKLGHATKQLNAVRTDLNMTRQQYDIACQQIKKLENAIEQLQQTINELDNRPFDVPHVNVDVSTLLIKEYFSSNFKVKQS